MARFHHILAHPLVLLAVGLVAINDFWLKAQFPSPLTGKLSDAGVLVVLPLLLAGLFSLAFNHRLAGVLSLGLVAGAYLLLKASPQSAAGLTNLVDLSGFHLRSIPDPSDLLVLPLLALPAWLWFRAPGVDARRPTRWQILLVPLAALVLLADAAMPDQGITCLSAQNGVLNAQGGYSRVFTSDDGGLSWAAAVETWQIDCGIPGDAQEALFSLPEGGAQYRVVKGISVERSADDGQTWQPLDFHPQVSEAEEAYVLKTRSGNISFAAPPLDALLDPASGSLLLAMGQQGVVVVRPDGSWQAVAVGAYARDSLKTAGAAGYFTLLTGELYFAVLAGLAWLGTAGLRGRRGAWRVVLVLGWLALLVTAAALHPTIANDSYMSMAPALGLIGSAALVAALLVGSVITLRAGILPKLPLALLLMVVVLLPYVLWGLAILPFYWIAMLLAVVLAAGAVIWVR